ncbi:histidyl-tRNA synthetase [Candidatus Tremblaya phenacola PAVE]|nr:histidyl-tRNA synthetase [Candidatus Tremblaya phenacola PAVE]
MKHLILKKVKGMRDIMPETAIRFERIRRVISSIMNLNGYQKLQTPVLEHEALYVNKIQSSADAFGKEMYCFHDKLSNCHLTLRPENTASVVRAIITNKAPSSSLKRLWYDEPMFRRERHQRGRYRQFFQIGVEALGLKGIEIETELIVLGGKVLDALSIGGLTLQLNTIGSEIERQAFSAHLLEFFKNHEAPLNFHNRRLLISWPLKILDCKEPSLKEIVWCSTPIYNFLTSTSLLRFSKLQKGLQDQSLPFQTSPLLIRGLDYYDHTVFEWCQKGSGRSLIAGGRYDGLVRLFGSNVGGCGWALGLERAEEASTLGPQPYSDVLILYSDLDEWEVANSIKKELEPFNLITILRPKKNLKRLRLKALEQGSNFLVYMLSSVRPSDKKGRPYADPFSDADSVVGEVLRNLPLV